MLQEMFVHWVRDLQLADECECRDVLTAVGDLSQLALEVADVGFEVVALPHLDSEKIVVVRLRIPMSCVLGEKRFRHLEVAERK